jgi:hypothetical protein
MKKIAVLLFLTFVILFSCDYMFGPDFVGVWDGYDDGLSVTYTLNCHSIKRFEGVGMETTNHVRGPPSWTETTITFRFTEIWNHAEELWRPITEDMPQYMDSYLTWGWSVDDAGKSLFLQRGSDTLTLNFVAAF